jgi:hydroxymethylpyrimidine pyrophosphatase-like HAD family hydrolase
MLEKAKRKRSAYYPCFWTATPAMVEYARELGLQDSYMISYNGAVITNLKENKNYIRTNTYTQEQIHSYYDYSVKHKTHIIPI